jgi:hypothetical protein
VISFCSLETSQLQMTTQSRADKYNKRSMLWVSRKTEALPCIFYFCVLSREDAIMIGDEQLSCPMKEKERETQICGPRFLGRVELLNELLCF